MKRNLGAPTKNSIDNKFPRLVKLPLVLFHNLSHFELTAIKFSKNAKESIFLSCELEQIMHQTGVAAA